MATDRQVPADIRSMGIVHSAIASHLAWMMQFLHQHHTGDDVGQWPLIRSRNPSAGPLPDQMDDDHRRIAPAIAALDGAAATVPSLQLSMAREES